MPDLGPRHEVVEESVVLEGPAGHLEAVLSYPEDAQPRGAVLLLAPHPHFAGDLDNNVVRSVAPALAGSGRAVLRFNYRGVGHSEMHGAESPFSFWERVEAEKAYAPIVEEAETAARALTRLAPTPGPPALVGYSFGAIVAALLATRRATEALVCIAPPLARYPFDFLPPQGPPTLFLLAEDDFLYGAEEAAALRSAVGPDPGIEWLAGADHFFRGLEAALAERVARFLASSPERQPAK